MSTPDQSLQILSPQAAVEQFEGTLEPVWKSPLYVAGLAVVATAMVLLPLIYVGLIGLTGYGLYYHATENATLLAVRGGARARLFVYIAPLVIGAVMIVFMIKPLFARRGRREKRLSLVRENDSTLFAFVEHLCDLVGAPRPRRIDVDCDINASASLGEGFLDLFQRRLVLTLGAPLVAGLSLREFGGVLAHEFGHFAQGLGMRLSYVIHRVNAWFARVVYERDAWDEKLVAASEGEGGWFSLILLLARLFVWITRKILWVLMWLGHGISCTMSRQMEFDADRYEMRVAGSACFEATMRKLPVLHAASQSVHADLEDAWRDGKLADNYPSLVVQRVAQFPPKLEKLIASSVDESRTGWFDTHPSSASRIARAQREDATGVLRATEPASALFRDFDGLCKATTLAFYHDVVGPQVGPANLIATEVLAARQKAQRQAIQAAVRFFQGVVTTHRPLAIDPYSKMFSATCDECVAKLRRTREALVKAGPLLRKRLRQHLEADEKMGEARTAQTLLAVGIPIEPDQFGLTAATKDACKESYARAERTRSKAAEDLIKGEKAHVRRIESALALLRLDGQSPAIEDRKALRSRSTELVETLTVLSETKTVMGKLREDQPSLLALGYIGEDWEDDEKWQAQVRRVLEQQHERLSELARSLGDAPYPFEHADGRVTMRRYAVESMPDRHDLGGLGSACGQAIDNIETLYRRVVGELAEIAERVESACGLEPLPTVEEPGDDSNA